MSDTSAEWTGEWVASRLKSNSDIQETELLAPQILRIVRNDLPPLLAATIASACVDRSTLEPILASSYEIAFIANIPRESFWTGAAISLATQRDIGFGGLGDLYSAMSLPNVREYVNKEFSFVERGLSQHTRVQDLERIHDRIYLVKRQGLADVRVVLLNEYELIADHVRTAHQRYGAFSNILITNPNGKATASAVSAASSMGADIYKWGEFLGRLNRP